MSFVLLTFATFVFDTWIVKGDGYPIGYAVPLREAATEDGAVCLDGSIPRYYIAKGTQLKKYHIYLEGGGWCSGVTQQYGRGFDSCLSRRYSALGSTTTSFDQPYLELTQASTEFSLTPSLNPLMYDWNAVLVRYCDGTSFSGNLDSPIYANITQNGVKTSVPIYFRGFRILKAVFLDLMKNQAMDEATDIVIHGGSAGGLATWLHSDYIKNELIIPNLSKNSNVNNVRISALPDSGFFLEVNGYISETKNVNTNFSNGMKYLFDVSNASYSGISMKCIEEYSDESNPKKIGIKNSIVNKNKAKDKNKDNYGYSGASECFFAQNIAKYVEIDMFAINAQYDEWQAENVLGTGTSDSDILNEYGLNFTRLFFTNYLNFNDSMNNVYHNRGAFIDSCYHHDFDWNNIYDQNYSHASAHAYWYQMKMINGSHENVYFFQDYTYPCADCCKAPSSIK